MAREKKRERRTEWRISPIRTRGRERRPQVLNPSFGQALYLTPGALARELLTRVWIERDYSRTRPGRDPAKCPRVQAED